MQQHLQNFGQFIEAAGNMVFYLIVVLILAFPPLVWINNTLSGRDGILWVMIAILFAIVAPVAMEIFAGSVMTVAQKIREGKLFGAFFRPLRSVSGALAIFGTFKLEYALVHGMPLSDGDTWGAVIGQFLTAF